MKITAKNTKKEILEAYKQLQKDVERGTLTRIQGKGNMEGSLHHSMPYRSSSLHILFSKYGNEFYISRVWIENKKSLVQELGKAWNGLTPKPWSTIIESMKGSIMLQRKPKSSQIDSNGRSR